MYKCIKKEFDYYHDFKSCSKQKHSYKSKKQHFKNIYQIIKKIDMIYFLYKCVFYAA